jgi:hypothetical protein
MTTTMALWLERNLDPDAPVERVFDGFRRAFPGASIAQLRAALALLARTIEDRLAAEEADLDAVLALLREA